MQKLYPIIAALSIVLAVSATFAVTNYQSETLETQYVPSNIANALNTVTEVTQSAASWSTNDISKVKHEVDYTIKGTVVNISEPIVWKDPTPKSDGYYIRNGENVKIEIDIKVDETTKAKTTLERDSIVTITITGKVLDKKLKLDGGEEQYELGEIVVVHVAEDPNDIIGENVNYVKLGEFGKYKIQDDKAYNALYPEGRSLTLVMSETG